MTAFPVTPWEGITPRKWQAAALPAAVEAVRQRKRAVISAVMGAGKSILIAELARQAQARLASDRCVVIATPTQKLVKQLSATVGERCGKRHVGQFYGPKKQSDRPIIVTCNPSLATLTGELALQGRRPTLLIQDECHSSEAQTVREVVPVLNPAGMIGFTATPFRSVSSQSLSLWDVVCYRYTLGEALRDKVLVPWRTVNWDGRGSDATDDVCLRMILEQGDGPGIASSLSIQDAEEFAHFLCKHGVPAAPIHSRMSSAAQDELLERLHAGDLRCLAHVSLLAEGVDLPWLRWLCLRRPVAARVRFMQELGRVLRSHPGKSEAVVMDPHDLLGSHGVQHAEALGKAMETEAEREERDADSAAEPKEVNLPPAKAVETSTQWARSLLLALQAAGSVPSSSVEAGYWRTRRPSAKQVATLGKLGRAFSRYLPNEHREAVLALSREPVARSLQRGAVSDLISVLSAVADSAPPDWRDRRGWTFDWPDGLAVPALEPGALSGLPTTPLDNIDAERRAWFGRHGSCSCGQAGTPYRKPYSRGVHVGLWCDPCDRWLAWIPQQLLTRPVSTYPEREPAGLFGGVA